MFRRFYNNILGGYDENKEYVTAKKAQFLFWFLLFYGCVLFLLPFSFIISGKVTYGLQAMAMSWPQVGMIGFAVYLIKKKKVRTAANIVGWLAFTVATIGFVMRPVPLSGMSLAYFQFAALSFSLFFCSYSIAIFFYITTIAVCIGYYFIIALPSVAGASQLIQDSARSMAIDIPAALTVLFITGMSATRIVNKALEIMTVQTEENRKQAAANEALVETIRAVSDRLSSSIAKTSSVISSFSENAQTQAASVEELTATIDEISAGTDSSKNEASDQNSSVKDLAASIEKLSSSIDAMEQYGSQISLAFSDFLDMAHGGEEASQKLDITNKQITQSSNEILSVVTIIEEFFDKIKMLSLNATIEAARAGEYGRGFAVVAAEIGKLSDDSTKELAQISELIEKNKTDVEKGNEVITEIITFIQSLLQGAVTIQQKTKDILDEIAKQKILKDEMNIKTDTTKNSAEMIELSMSEQKRAIDDVVHSISDTNDIVQKNAENTATLQENADELTALADELNRKFG